VIRARCLPYGDGITFWPVADLVKRACAITSDDSREQARAKIEVTLRRLVGRDQTQSSIDDHR
jgi:hypothetical protein